MVGGLADGARPQQRQHEVIELPLPRRHVTLERREGKRKRAAEDEEETEKPQHTRHRLSPDEEEKGRAVPLYFILIACHDSEELCGWKTASAV
ncbi:hypothetical protein GW17_00055149 [Ensete ventricosum]|nr:hypothetical protein GW17_00055149 [Ensete ventricosum]